VLRQGLQGKAVCVPLPRNLGLSQVIRLKDGVSLAGLTPQALLIAVVADQVYAANGASVCVITSGSDGAHKPKSKHYDGKALDFRTLMLTADKQQKVRAEIAAALGTDFDVILESDHIHAEFDPK
jgi:hypothetical protein